MAKRQREKDLSSLPNKRAASGQQDTSSAKMQQEYVSRTPLASRYTPDRYWESLEEQWGRLI